MSRRKQALLFGFFALLVGLLGLGLGGPLLLMGLSRFQNNDTPAQTPWQGPAGTRWAGAELRAMQRLNWRGKLEEEYLELRCVARPRLKMRLDYWPGAAWDGWVEWQTDGVVYVPSEGRPKRLPAKILVPEWLTRCPTS